MGDVLQGTLQATRSQLAVREGPMLVDRVAATSILADCAFEGQRPIQKHHVRLLASIMDRGEWIPNDQMTFCQLPGGRLVLVNGHHRCTAIVNGARPQVFSIRIIPVEDMDAVRRVYSTFDTATRKRSDGEIIEAMGILETHGLTKGVAASVFRAAPLIANKFKTMNYQTHPEEVRDVTARIMAAEHFWAAGVSYQECIKAASQHLKAKLLIVSVAAVAIITLSAQTVKATAFWTGLASGVGLPKNDPRLTLSRTLLDRRYLNRFKDGEIPQPAQDCAAAWNAFYENRKIGSIRAAAFRIAGTTWR